MPDLTPFEAELRQHYPEPWVRHHLDSFSPAYFEAFRPEEVGQHLELIRALDDAQLAIALAWPTAVLASPRPPAEADQWWVEIVGYDAFQLLSTLCNLLAVHGLSIVEGRVFTSRTPPRADQRRTVRRPAFRARPPSRSGASREKEPDRRPKIVDRFLVRRVESAPPPDWSAFQHELQSLVRLLHEGHHEEVHHRLIGRVVAALRRQRDVAPALEPIELTIDPGVDPQATLVQIAAPDSFGFLSLTASALALCGIRIVQAEIRTVDGRVNDALWVTGHSGEKIVDEAPIRELRLSLILIEHFSSRLHRATNPEAALVHFSRFAHETMSRTDWAEEFAALDQPAVLDALVQVLGESDFLWEDYLHARPEDLLPMVGDPAQWRRRARDELTAELDRALGKARDEEAQINALRRFKDREVFRAGFRAILAPDGALATLADELSDVAEVLLQAALTVSLHARQGALPLRPDHSTAPAALFALGKFGGRELGFASDLELMLVYDDRTVLDCPGAPSAGAAFDSLVATLRRLLAGRQGSTFELDFRLRPYGRAGALATAFSTFAEYYRSDGPAWSYERQALIKLRAVQGDPEFIAAVEAHRDRFVYGPEPFDLEGYRRMRRLQLEQRVQPGRINAKFSPGALVDAEYLVQAMQIAHGGRHPSLRTPNTESAVTALQRAGLLSASEGQSLHTCYRFFRALVDALRVVHGHAQDLTVPAVGSDDFILLARRMRYPEPQALKDELNTRLESMQDLASRVEDFVRPASG